MLRTRGRETIWKNKPLEGGHSMIKKPIASYSILIRLEILPKPGMLGKVTSAIVSAGGDIVTIDIVGFGKNPIVRDMGKMELKQIIGLVVAFAVIGLIVHRSILWGRKPQV